MVVDRALDDIVKDQRKRRQQKLKQQKAKLVKKNTPVKNRNQQNNRNNGPKRNNKNNNQLRGNSQNRKNFNNNQNRNNNNNNNRSKKQLQNLRNGNGNANRNQNGNNNASRRPNNRNNNPRARQSYLNRRAPPNANRNLNKNRTVTKNRNLGPIRKALTTKKNQAPRQDIPVQIHVSNLHPKVSDKDMRELFGEFGKLKSVNLHYDRNGKPQGSCDIKFAKKSEAVKAVKRYNKVPLDGKPMQIRVVEDLSQPQVVRPVAQRITQLKKPNQNQAAKKVAGRRVTNNPIRPANAMRQKKMLMMRKSAGRANKVRNLTKKKPANNASNNKSSPTKKKIIIKKKPEKKLTEEDLDKQLDAYLTAGSML